MSSFGLTLKIGEKRIQTKHQNNNKMLRAKQTLLKY